MAKTKVPTKHWILEFNYSDSLVEIYEQCTAELFVYGKYPIMMFVLKEGENGNDN